MFSFSSISLHSPVWETMDMLHCLQKKERDGTLTPHGIEDHRLPGPFRLYSHLQHVLDPNTWGEEIILTLVSMMWQTGITVVYAETLLQKRVRHSRYLEMTDLVLVYCGIHTTLVKVSVFHGDISSYHRDESFFTTEMVKVKAETALLKTLFSTKLVHYTQVINIPWRSIF